MKTIGKRILAFVMCVMTVAALLPATVASADVETTKSQLKNAEVGDIITFGNFHGAKEWQVLSVQEARVFVISRQGLDCRRYNETSEAVLWEDCSLRAWLNSDFIDEAFTAEEQDLILTTEVINSRLGKYGDDGNDTKDRVYILNMDESSRYFEDADDRKTTATQYAIDKGARVDKKNVCSWWLRSRGEIRNKTAYVYVNGKRDYLYVSNYTLTVRPVMWLSKN